MTKAVSRFRSGILAAVAALGLAVVAQPTFAAAAEAEIGSRAYTNHPLPLHAGPGDNMPILGELPGGLEVRVDRCHVLWCAIHTGRVRGWVFVYSLSFGQGPNSVWWPLYPHHHDRYHRW